MSNPNEWEYKIVRTTGDDLFSSDTFPMEGALNSLGGGSWEFMDMIADSHSAGANSGQAALVFK